MSSEERKKEDFLKGGMKNSMLVLSPFLSRAKINFIPARNVTLHFLQCILFFQCLEEREISWKLINKSSSPSEVSLNSPLEYNLISVGNLAANHSRV